MRIVADQVQLTVPATSANLGAGFDSLGLALELRDRVSVRAIAGPTRVTVRGEGAGRLPDGEDHLVVRAIRVGLEFCGAPQVGLSVTCHNVIPHARGMGSSAAAAVVGLAAARALVSEPDALDDDALLQLATDFEGHPDNAAPALFGGATLAWMEEGQSGWTPLEVSPEVTPVVLVPPTTSSTSGARAALPRSVPYADAVYNLQRAALMTQALKRPELLMVATGDRLHQRYRSEVMGQSIELVESLRARGIPAVLSGAGPSVLAFGRPDDAFTSALLKHEWQVMALPVADKGVVATHTVG